MKKVGRIEAIVGCMFSGKTEELLRRLKRAEYARQRFLLLKPTIDTRYSEECVVTHSGQTQKAYRIPIDVTLKDLKARFPIEDIAVIGFDEAQFFDKDSFPELVRDLAFKEGKRVIISGLDLDFKGDPFGPIPFILALADEVVKLTAVCVICGNPANRTQRLINGKPAPRNSPVIVIGGSELYQPRCPSCWEVPE